MADNVQITPGSGNVIAADEVTDGTLGVAKVQYIKLMDGTINSVNKAVINSGGALLVDATATVQPISGTVSLSGTSPISGTVTAVQPTGTNLHVVVDTAPTTAVTGTFFQATQPVSGTVTANAGTGSFTVAQATGTNLHVVVDTAPTTTVTGTVTANAGTGSFTVAQATGTNLHAVLDATSTTAVTQATGTNLHTVVDSGTITTVTTLTGITNALPAGTNLIGVTGVAQNSTTSGQSGELVQGAVTSGPPSYTTTKTSPLSLSTAGHLRVTAVTDQGISSSNFSNKLLLCFPNEDSGNVGPAWVCLGTSGGTFGGTADTTRQGITVNRTPTVFKTVSATASGDTAVWTAATGNKWRLLGYRIEVTSNASLASGAVLTVKFRDVTTDIALTHDIFVPTTAVTTAAGDAYDSGSTLLGSFGILAAATATALNINLSAALVTGNVRVMVYGTEE